METVDMRKRGGNIEEKVEKENQDMEEERKEGKKRKERKKKERKERRGSISSIFCSIEISYSLGSILVFLFTSMHKL